MRFLDQETMVEWLVQHCTDYPRACVAVGDDDAVDIMLLQENSIQLRAGLLEYPEDVSLVRLQEDVLIGVTVGYAGRRMRLTNLVRSEER